MKKSLLLVALLLLFSGCEEAVQQSNEHFTVTGNQVTVVDENITFNIPGDFTVDENIIEFGPESHIPESPTDGNYKKPAFKLEIIPKRTIEEIPYETEPVVETINDHQVIKWSLQAFCYQNRYELVGEKNNILIRSTTCEDHDSETVFTEMLNS